jgi:hypothetical protein
VIACGVGFTLAHVAADWAGLWLPVAWVLASEVVLGVTIRDNMLLMGMQLIAPSAAVTQWQSEILTRREQQRTGKIVGGGYWPRRFRSRRYEGAKTVGNLSLERWDNINRYGSLNNTVNDDKILGHKSGTAGNSEIRTSSNSDSITLKTNRNINIRQNRTPDISIPELAYNLTARRKLT